MSTSAFHPNDLNEIVRDIAGDLVERVELIDEFVHPKTNRVSNCFRISYRSMDRSLKNEEIDALQERVSQGRFCLKTRCRAKIGASDRHVRNEVHHSKIVDE